MNGTFNYKEPLNNIKANLFDIYEDQEEAIGREKNTKSRSKRLNKFIEIKDIALMLLEGIEYLYEETNDDKNLSEEKVKKIEIPEEEEESKLLDLVNEQDAIDKEKEEVGNVNLKKYYLNCDKSRINFAYVPKDLYEKIKSNFEFRIKSADESKNYASSTNMKNSNDIDNKIKGKNEKHIFMKDNQSKPRGIIVRSDQYMKLALSRHRQESVLEEAKTYRVKEVKKRQRENQKIELEKAKIDISI